MRRKLAAFAAMALPLSAAAQSFPTKPIRWIVPFPPGGVDITVRLIQPAMQADLGQSIVIENRAGANGYIGTEVVARSAPDGHTLLSTSSGTLVAGPLISKETPFDTLKDFTPITQFFKTVSAIVAKSSLPVNTLADLIAYGKKNPGKLSYGSSGVGSVQQLDGEIFKRAAGIDMVHVPYKGGGPQSQAVASGEIDVSFHPMQQVRSLILAGKVKGLSAYGSGSRFHTLPNMPDITETLPGVVTSPSWVGTLAPAGLPAPVLARINGSIVKALTSAEIRPKIEENQVLVAGTPQEFAAVIRGDFERTAKLVKELKAAGVKLE